MASSAVPCWSPEFNALEVTLGGGGGYPRLFPISLLGQVANSSSHLLPLEDSFQHSDQHFLFWLHPSIDRPRWKDNDKNIIPPDCDAQPFTSLSFSWGPLSLLYRARTHGNDGSPIMLPNSKHFWSDTPLHCQISIHIALTSTSATGKIRKGKNSS